MRAQFRWLTTAGLGLCCGVAAAQDAPATEAVVDTGVIEDPELSDPPATAITSGPDTDAPDDFVPTGDVRLVLQSRTGVDLVWRRAREDVVDATQIMLIETHLRRSENLRFVAGLRARHQIATRREATSEADAVRHSLDVVPTAAYADITVDDGIHVRAGYQVTRIGRFDLFSATNMLAVADLRSGAASMPDAIDVAQPAVRLDWDANSWLNVQVIHVPFFQPHIVDFVEGDYAMFQTTQADVEAGLDALAEQEGSPPADCNAPDAIRDSRCRIRAWWKQISRSGTASVASGGLGAFGTTATLANPQGTIRVTARAPLGELSVTLGTALEHLPSLFVDKPVQDVMRDSTLSQFDIEQRLGQVTRPFDVEYNRYYVISTDGAMPVGPLQVGFEAAYMFDRTLYSAQTECSHPPRVYPDNPNPIDCVFYAPTPQQTDMLHGALRLELAQDESLLVGLEAFAAYTLDPPKNPTNHAWLTLMDGRYMMGTGLMARWSPVDTGWTFEFSGVAMNGPTVMVTPRVQWRALDTLYVELGAIWVEGAKRPPATQNFSPRGTSTSVDWAIGGMYTNVDQVFAGLKWTP